MVFDFKIALFILIVGMGALDSIHGMLQQENAWKEFSCKEEEFGGLSRKRLEAIVLRLEKVYFLFKEFMIRIDFPEFSYRVDNGGVLYYLAFSTPQYLNYSRVPSILQKDYTGYLQILNENKVQERNFIIEEFGGDDDYKLYVREIANTSDSIFDLDKNQLTQYNYLLYKYKYEPAYARKDNDKLVLVRFRTNLISFEFYNVDKSDAKYDGDVEIHDIKYAIDKSIYYQPKTVRDFEEPFESFIMDIENTREGSKLHLHSFAFLREADMKIHLINYDTIGMLLDEFLDCPIMIESVEQLKGSFSTVKESDPGKPPSFRFYLFIDDFYYRTKWNLVTMNFQILDKIKWRKNAQRVQFPADLPFEKRPVEEKLTLKYLKNLNDTYYLAYNLKQTHLLEIVNPRKPDEILRVTETNKPLHRCEFQLLTVENQIFCFERQRYWFFSEDNGQTVVPKDQVFHHNIADIFADSELQWEGQDVIAIIRYKYYYVWMTYDYLHKFNVRYFFTVQASPDRDPVKRQIGLKVTKNIPEEFHHRIKNCLFNYAACDLAGEGTTPSKRWTDEGGLSILILLVLFILFIILSTIVWVWMNPKIRNNLRKKMPFLDNLNLRLKSKFSKSAGPPPATNQKAADLKSVKSTSSPPKGADSSK